MHKRYGIALLAVTMFVGSAPAAEKSPIGRKLNDLPLNDYRGKAYNLDAFKEHKLLVVAVLGADCPLARLYGPRLAKLSEEFKSQGVGFVGLSVNYQDSIVEIAAYAHVHGVRFPILKDVGQRVADELGAKRTPEVFVLDKDRVVRYSGRIDDQYSVGAAKDAPQSEDLKKALIELLAEKEVSTPTTPAPGCLISRVEKPKPDSPVTYSEHVAPILQKRCVECHRKGDIGPFALTTYGQAASKAATIAEVIEEGRMPPWHADRNHGEFANNRRLTEEEKRLVLQWVAGGAVEGKKAEPLSAPAATGWQIPREPDQVVYIRDKPYEVQAEGTVRYQYFVADPGFTEDKWLAAIEVQPSSRAVVHHILVFAYTGDRKALAGGGVGGYLAAYVPGLRATPYGEGMAKRFPAGSKLLFQIHYTPIGSKQEDRSKVGLWFADPKQVKHEVKTISTAQQLFLIPANGDHVKVEGGAKALPADAKLLGFMPHMHLRGSAFRYTAELPDGTKETLLDVPRFDFNWQTSYRLAKSRNFPEGTRIRGAAHFDNSTNNPHNPDPKKAVYWGEQTWQEMMIGYFDIAVPLPPK